MNNTKFLVLLTLCVAALLVVLARGQEKNVGPIEPAGVIEPTESDLAPLMKIEKSDEQWARVAERGAIRGHAAKGHGTAPTHLRYCMNGGSFKFEPRK